MKPLADSAFHVSRPRDGGISCTAVVVNEMELGRLQRPIRHSGVFRFQLISWCVVDARLTFFFFRSPPLDASFAPRIRARDTALY